MRGGGVPEPAGAAIQGGTMGFRVRLSVSLKVCQSRQQLRSAHPFPGGSAASGERARSDAVVRQSRASVDFARSAPGQPVPGWLRALQ